MQHGATQISIALAAKCEEWLLIMTLPQRKTLVYETRLVPIRREFLAQHLLAFTIKKAPPIQGGAFLKYAWCLKSTTSWIVSISKDRDLIIQNQTV